jgi:Lysyl oxidase
VESCGRASGVGALIAWVTAAAAVFCGAVTVWATQAASPAGGSSGLLPDLSPQSPRGLTVRVEAGDGHPRFWLGFRSAADNLGVGPLVVDATRDRRRPSLLATTQVVTRSDGSEERRPLRARLRYVRSVDHSHGHYLGFMRYQLRRAGGGRLVGRDRKTGFCLGDRYLTPAGRSVQGRRAPAAFESWCGRGRPGLTRLREGISVGWGDDYDAHLDGQEIEITDLHPGRYLLVHTVNPDHALAELSYRNNTSRAAIRMARDARGRPTVKLLRAKRR